jgi:uncharacterized repeat protein (TIGR01451 family)
MNHRTYRKCIGALLVALAVLSIATLGARARPVQPAPQTVQSVAGGPPIVLLASQGQQPFRVAPPPEFSELRIQSAAITIHYITPGTQNALGDACLAWPAGAQTAFNYAAGIWASLLNSSVPIEINACWTNLAPNILGHSAPESYHRGASGMVGNTWYSAALANALSSSDLNDHDGFDWDNDGTDADAEMEIAYSGNGIAWYFGSDGVTPAGQYDFVSVVLHEIGHGLGFLGSMTVSAGQGRWGFGIPVNPLIYDRFTENVAGQSLLDTGLFPNPSPALAIQLQSNNLYFDGANANAANGGNRPKLFAPLAWMPGSSYVHLDEIYNGSANALMTYSLNDGEAIHNPGLITRGILTDLGWALGLPAADLNIVKRVAGPATFNAGDLITFTLTIANSSDITATQVVVTDVVPSQVLTPAVASTLAITRTGLLTYAWNVEPLAAGRSGVITISGRINSVLTAPFTLVNSASIAGAEDNTPGNNTSSVTVIVNAFKTHLPIVAQRWPPIPDTPTLNAIGNADGDGSYTVSWNVSYLAITYTLQEDDNADFSSPTTVYAGASTSATIAGKPLGTFYYRVKATNTWGDSGWSNAQSVAVQSVWATILGEDFEGAFPGVWTVFDNNGTSSGEYIWGNRTCRAYIGARSGWAVGGGANGATLGCGSLYPHNAQSWMVYGPFSLSGATNADLRFKLWLYSQSPDDKLCWMASLDGNFFQGTCASGNSSGWMDQVLDLTNVSGLGNLLGQPNVWIALIFTSNDSVTYAEGGYVDNVVLRRCNLPACVGSSSATAVPESEELLVFPSAMTLSKP